MVAAAAAAAMQYCAAHLVTPGAAPQQGVEAGSRDAYLYNTWSRQWWGLVLVGWGELMVRVLLH